MCIRFTYFDCVISFLARSFLFEAEELAKEERLARCRPTNEKFEPGPDILLKKTIQDVLNATLSDGTLAGIKLDPLNIMEALREFNPNILDEDGKIFIQDLNFTILGLEYRVSVYFWDFVVEGLKATEAKTFLLKRSSSLEDFSGTIDLDMGNLALTGKYDLRTNCESSLGVFSFGLSACDQLQALKGTNVLSASLKNMRLRLDFKLSLVGYDKLKCSLNEIINALKFIEN